MMLMIKYFLTVAVVFSALFAQNGFAQDRTIEITGEIIDSETKKPVPYVHIINKTDSVGSVSNTEGRFWITIQPTDTLLFSAIGFETLSFRLKDNVRTNKLVLTIELDESTLELNPVKVFAFRDEESFKRALIDTKVTIQESEKRGIQLPGFYYGTRKEPKVGLGSPISFIATKFSKEVKERKKLEAFKKQESFYTIVKNKYNNEVVKEITQLPEDKVEEFMVFCQLPDSFIHDASQYELVIAIQKCLKEFDKGNN